MDVATLQRRVHERLDDELVAAYERDSAVCIRQLLDRDELALLRDGIEANLAQPSPAGQGAPMDQQEIAADMALSMVRPLADQPVIAAAVEMKAFAQAARGSKFPTVVATWRRVGELHDCARSITTSGRLLRAKGVTLER